jgi:riboflavin synthase
MFTGLIQDIGVVESLEKLPDSIRITIASKLTEELEIGDSISINGVCLTATAINNPKFTADVMIQTLKLSNLGGLEIGMKVNAELATRTDSRLGGHIVQGHVDGIGTVTSSTPGDKWQQFIVEIPQKLRKYVVNQGSICIDGVSLTVGEIADDTSRVTLWLIPETLAKTTLALKKTGDKVNIEVDVLAKYVERLIIAQNFENRFGSDDSSGAEK